MNSNVHEIGLSCLVYVSRSTLALEGDAYAVDQIVSHACARNAILRVTGAVIYTELHFGQVLEGPARAIDELMNSILQDERHRDVTIVAEHKLSVRAFDNWTMAYSGPSPYLDRHLKQLMNPANSLAEKLPLVERVTTIIRGQLADPETATLASKSERFRSIG